MTNWQAAVAALVTLAGMLAAGHALLNKRDPRAALGWCAICIMVPLIGAVLYTLFGINRVHSRARRLQLQERNIPGSPGDCHGGETDSIGGPLAPLANLSATLQGWPLLAGNDVRELRNGEQAYPEMLEAIGQARSRVCLSSYIFDTDASGAAFIDALADAVGPFFAATSQVCTAQPGVFFEKFPQVRITATSSAERIGLCVDEASRTLVYRFMLEPGSSVAQHWDAAQISEWYATNLEK